MGVSVKVALLTCIAFTTGVCWLVNQVSRQPGVATPAAPTPTTLMSKTSFVPPTDQLQRPSAGEPSREVPSSPPAVAIHLEPAPVSPAPDAVALPPIVPPETVIASTRAGESHPTEAEPVPELAQDAPSGPPTVAADPQVTPQPATYKVAKGDSLSRIAARTYGADSPEVRKAIIALNPKIAKRPNCLYAGEELQLPALAGSANPVRGVTPSAMPAERPRGGPPEVAIGTPPKSADVPRPGRIPDATKSPQRPQPRADTAIRNEKRPAAPSKPSVVAAGKPTASKSASVSSRTARSKEPPVLSASSKNTAAKPVVKPAAKTAAKPSGTAKPAGKAKPAREVATASRNSKATPASAKTKDAQPGKAVAKESKPPAVKPNRASDSKPVTRRRGGSIDAG